MSNDLIEWPNLDVSETDLVTRVDVLVSQTEEFESKWSKWSKWSKCRFEEQTSFKRYLWHDNRIFYDIWSRFDISSQGRI